MLEGTLTNFFCFPNASQNRRGRYVICLVFQKAVEALHINTLGSGVQCYFQMSLFIHVCVSMWWWWGGGSSCQLTQTLILIPHNLPTLSCYLSCPSWVMRNNDFFFSNVLPFFSPSTQSPVLHSLPSAASPLAVGKWTKAPLNRPMRSVKARGLDLSWRGGNAIHIGPRPAAR